MLNLCVGGVTSSRHGLRDEGALRKGVSLKCTIPSSESGRGPIAVKLPNAVIRCISSFLEGSNTQNQSLRNSLYGRVAPFGDADNDSKVPEEARMCDTTSDDEYFDCNPYSEEDVASGSGAAYGPGVFSETSMVPSSLRSSEGLFLTRVDRRVRVCSGFSSHFNLVNSDCRQSRIYVICEILNKASRHPEISEIITELELEISNNPLIPDTIKSSDQYLLHRLMDSLTSTKTLEAKHYSDGVHGIYSFKQVLEAYKDFKEVDDRNFLKCIKALRDRLSKFCIESCSFKKIPIAPDLRSISEIKLWLRTHTVEKASSFGLELYKLELEVIPRGIFALFSEYTWFDFSDNSITKVTPNTFFGATQVKHLDLDDNNIGALPDFSFVNAPKLDNLSLKNYRIPVSLDKIAPKAFAGLLNLTTLYLESKGEGFPWKVLDPLGILKRLSFTHTLSVLPNSVFKNNTNLEALNLTLPELSCVEEDCLVGLSSLKNFTLRAGAHLRSIPQNLLVGVQNLSRVTLIAEEAEGVTIGILRPLENRYCYWNIVTRGFKGWANSLPNFSDNH